MHLRITYINEQLASHSCVKLISRSVYFLFHIYVYRTPRRILCAVYPVLWLIKTVVFVTLYGTVNYNLCAYESPWNIENSFCDNFATQTFMRPDWYHKAGIYRLLYFTIEALINLFATFNVDNLLQSQTFLGKLITDRSGSN